MTARTITDLSPHFYGADPRVVPDGRDWDILRARADAIAADNDIRVGDFVRFADGVERRVSYVWGGDEYDSTLRVQTSAGGSYYLGDGYVSMSGGLFPPVDGAALAFTGDYQLGAVWFFHHDWHHAHNGVFARIPFRVWSCSTEATR